MVISSHGWIPCLMKRGGSAKDASRPWIGSMEWSTMRVEEQVCFGTGVCEREG